MPAFFPFHSAAVARKSSAKISLTILDSKPSRKGAKNDICEKSKNVVFVNVYAVFASLLRKLAKQFKRVRFPLGSPFRLLKLQKTPRQSYARQQR